MSRIVPAGVGEADDSPALPILPEDASEMGDAVAELNRSINALSKLSGNLGTNSDYGPVTDLLKQVLLGQATIIAFLRDKPKRWQFDFMRHPNGDVERILAREAK